MTCSKGVTVKAAALALLLVSGLAYAQAPAFQHIVVLVQENRTPDNLFYACKIPGADLRTTGVAVSITYGGGIMSHSHRAYLKELRGQYPTGSNNYVVATDIQPYCQLAKQYGFGNYVFQTNQGPSLPAHQFLISGTSSPTETSNLFVSDNASPKVGDGTCNAPPGSWVPTIAPDGTNGPRVFPCFTRSSIVDNLQAAKLTWKYYAVSSKPSWDGPIAMKNLYQSPNNVLNPKQVLADIQGGKLANVAFVTPTGFNSDHPGATATGGPAWVANIVNAIGNSQYWSNTAIVVTWDDWGGWWDHVAPTMLTSYAPQYIYGFRVPFLVISAYTPSMVSNVPCDCFGCILKFIESQFNLGLIGEGRFADAYANDDLSEYFTAQYRTFVPVPTRRLTAAELSDTSDPDDY